MLVNNSAQWIESAISESLAYYMVFPNSYSYDMIESPTSQLDNFICMNSETCGVVCRERMKERRKRRKSREKPNSAATS